MTQASGPGGRSAPDALNRLLSGREMAAATFGLERIRAMLDTLERPDRAYRVAHIAGTNGKGSTSAMLAGILGVRHRVGLFTSPHLASVRERFVVDGRPVRRAALERSAERVLPAARVTRASYFEAATALACLAFAEDGVDWAVFETGLGGRLDATNALEPVLTVLTPIGLDHQAYLGATLERIAAEKAGILKPGVPCVAAHQAPAAREVLDARARDVGAPLHFLGRESVRVVETTWRGTGFELRDGERWSAFHTSLVGAHQAHNAALAAVAARLGADANAAEIRRGLAGARLPGRLERLDLEDGTWLLDVAHNPSGVDALLDALSIEGLPLPIVCLTAILGDKPWREMLDRLSRRTAGLVLTLAPSAPEERRWPTDEVRTWAAADPERAAEFTADFDQALALARIRCGRGTVLVTGSFHTVGDARARLLAGSEADTD